jgi:hypothetical protein
MTDDPLVTALRTHLEANERCAGGLLGRERVVLIEHGPLSYEHDRELLCLVRKSHPVQILVRARGAHRGVRLGEH